MEELPNAERPDSPVEAAADRLLSKYVAVWLWTIFFGANSGVTYTYYSYIFRSNPGAMFGPGSPLPPWLSEVQPTALSLSILASAAAWGYLFFFFSVYLIPVVFQRLPEAQGERRRVTSSSFLNRAFLLLIAAWLTRILPDFVAFLILALKIA